MSGTIWDAADPLEWADNWVALHLPSTVTRRSGNEATAHYTAFSNDYGRLLTQLEVAYATLVDLVDALERSGKSRWANQQTTQFLLLHHNSASFESALTLLSRGFYNDAISVTRSCYEAFVRMVFAGCHPNNAFSVFVRSPGPGHHSFNLTGFLRDELRVDWQRIYAVLSTFAHSNSYPSLIAAQELSAGANLTDALERPRLFNSERIETTAPLIVFTLLGHLRIAIESVASATDLVSGDPLERAVEAKDFLAFQVANHAKPFWRTTADDLDEVLGFISLAAAGEDWKPLVAERPNVAPG